MQTLKPIPGREHLTVKEDFTNRYKELLGERYNEFMEHSTSFIRRSIRANTLKITASELKKRLQGEWKLEQIPWCKEGFWIKGQRLDIGNLPEHALGYMYVQEAASMIPPIALSPEPGETVLDMCAAPGSKTTQMAAMMRNEGIIVANDISGDRIKALGINLNRSGVSNTIITHTEGRALEKTKFDCILVDAPCSATGTIRRNLKVIMIYNYGMVKRLSGIQKGLLMKAYGLLKEGGALVYSTCTMEPEENEGVISWLLEKEETANVESIKLNAKSSTPITDFNGSSYNSEVRKCLRLWPQDNDTEGFFVARVRKG